MIYVPQVIGPMHSTWGYLAERWDLPDTRLPLQRRSLREPSCTKWKAASHRSHRHSRVSDHCWSDRFSSHSVSFLVLGIADLNQTKLWNISTLNRPCKVPVQSSLTIRMESIRIWNVNYESKNSYAVLNNHLKTDPESETMQWQDLLRYNPSSCPI